MLSKKNYVIAPRFTLPMKQVKPTKNKRSLIEYLSLVLVEVIYLGLAFEMLDLAFWYFVAWPIYKVVAFVVVIILWSNVASSAARNKSAKEQTLELIDTMSMQAVRVSTWGKEQPKRIAALSSDTTAYLVALKKTLVKEL